VHVAERVIECSPSIRIDQAPWRVWLPGGQLVRGRGNRWPFDPGDIPANARTLRVGTTGTGEVVQDNMLPIGTVLERHNASVPGPPLPDDDRGCSAAGAGSSAALFGVLVLGALAIVRRRR
jgi:MYXO-CTERM domain-containing protein